MYHIVLQWQIPQFTYQFYQFNSFVLFQRMRLAVWFGNKFYRQSELSALLSAFRQVLYYNSTFSSIEMTSQATPHSLLKDLQEKLSSTFEEKSTSLVDFSRVYDRDLIQLQYEAKIMKATGSIRHFTSQLILVFLQNLNEADCGLDETLLIHELTRKLQSLNTEPKYLLSQGILTLYADMNDLEHSTRESHSIHELVIKISKQILKALRIFLTYKEYQDHLARFFPQRQMLSLHEVEMFHEKPEQKSSSIEQQLLDEVQVQCEGMSVVQLFELYIRQRQSNLEEHEDLCRICSEKVKISAIEDHVRHCQKQSNLRQQLQDQESAIDLFKDQLRDLYNQVKVKSIKNEKDLQFMFLVKNILTEQNKNSRSAFSKASIGAISSQKSIKSKGLDLLQEYLSTLTTCNPTLQRYYDAVKLKMDLEKQYYFANYQQRSRLSHGKSISSLQSVENQRLKATRRSSIKCQDDFSQYQTTMYEEKDGISEMIKEPQYQMCSQSEFDGLWVSKLKKKHSDMGSSISSVPQNTRSYRSMQDLLQKEEDCSITLENFEPLKFIGSGAFGKVYLVRRSETKDFYALKTVKISEECTSGELENIENQHEIFKKISGHHLVKAPFSFTERGCQIFVLEYLPGGDLRRVLDDEVYLSEEQARFYLAEIVLAIEHLHKHSIIHRDLKPENLVIDKGGHLKLTDFGLSEVKIQQKIAQSLNIEKEQKYIKRAKRRRLAGFWGNKDKVKIVGTPDYIAPQIISQMPTDSYSVDWWSLGVMAYELMIGARPFAADTVEEVIDNIINNEIQWPEIGYEQGMISPQAKDLICQLLNPDFANRLGANGVNEIKQHQFFREVDWETVKVSVPPFVPRVKNTRQYNQLQEDAGLKKEIYESIGKKLDTTRRLKLQKFVRFDLLGTQTIESVSKVYEKEQSQLVRLRKLLERIKSESELCHQGS